MMDLSDWPKTPDGKRNICSSDKPRPYAARGLWAHENAQWIGETPDHCGAIFQCSDCGARWTHWHANDDADGP